MALKETTHLILNMFEEFANLAFILIVATKLIEAMPVMGWLYVSSMPQKLVKFGLEAIF